MRASPSFQETGAPTTGKPPLEGTPLARGDWAGVPPESKAGASACYVAGGPRPSLIFAGF